MEVSAFNALDDPVGKKSGKSWQKVDPVNVLWSLI